ncbi:acetylxylan esterase [Brachybacterium timonense]|uniref:acetylxylan esterase n=1 Tax=Brachybacterium timonense TaxID=2050896 RepID=UPI003182FD5A
MPDVDAVLCDVPFLCHIRRAIDITDEFPYQEIVQYLSTNRDRLYAVEHTLGYVDSVHHARRAGAALNMSVGLRDMVRPPSTVYAAYNHDAGASGGSPEKTMTVHAFNKH